jgi:translocation and assembly module TamB
MVRNAQLAAFTPNLSQYLSPQGELNIDVEMQPGPKFTGVLKVSHARTRSLAAFGPIRDIAVNMNLEGDKIRLDSATGNIGGATVTANGEADLHGMNWSDFAVPPLKFSLRGTNVPLARRPESVIRSDLDLVVTKTNGSPALVSGKAHLGNSYFLHDIADLIPGKMASPGRRPPYFSIDFEPIADWRLAVQVTGERFLKVRSTIFNGEVSANLALKGTLKDPLALGDIRIDSGFVRFPFADLKVQQGFVTLTSQNPYRPQLRVSAVSRQYGYDIKMDVSGPADAAILQFTSSPPLSSEQIVLMITAGELPREGRSLSTQQRAQTLAFYVGKDLLTRLGFGDDKEQRLTIHSGEQLSEQGRPTYNVEYELTERWSLVGEYDRFNAYNAGLKWRIYSK